MKFTTLLPLALAYTATAELQLYSLPEAPAKRDLTTVTTVVSQISDAITQLDGTVKSFATGADPTTLQQDANTLISTLKSGAEKVAASTSEITLADIAGLQDAATSLATQSGSLLTDLAAKKAALEAAGLCDSVKSTLQSIGAGVQGLVSNVISQLPEDAQAAATQLASGITGSLTEEIAGFACSGSGTGKDVADTYPVSSSSAAGATETCSEDVTSSSAEAVTATPTLTQTSSAQCLAVTVTVTQDCACGTTTSSSSSISIPVVTPSVSVPFPTGANSTATFVPTGGVSTTSATSIPTAAAVANGVGAVGLVAGLAAALFV